MKSAATHILIYLFLIFVTGSSLRLYFKANSRANRMEANLTAANQQAETYRTRDGHQASRIKAQELTIQELRKINPAIISQLQNLYIPPTRTEAYTETRAELSAEVVAPIVPGHAELVSASAPQNPAAEFIPVQDPDKENDTLKTFAYSDKWLKVTGEIYHDSTRLNIGGVDTVFIGIFRGQRRHPARWIFSRRHYEAAATNRNPYIKMNILSLGVIKK